MALKNKEEKNGL